MARSDDNALGRGSLVADQPNILDLGQSEELRVPKTAEIVADRIRKRIISGDLDEGSSLPPEGQLLEQFGVSRPTLREAFRILEAERLISVTRGSRSGARVSRPKVSGVSRYASLVLQANETTVPDIFEARLALELYVVRRLARTGAKASLEILRNEIDRLERLDEAGDKRGFIAALTEFHELLVEQGGNRTLHFMIQMLHDLMDQVKLRLIRRDAEGRIADSGTALKSMRKLIDLIEAGDGDGAAKHWRLHLINATRRGLSTAACVTFWQSKALAVRANFRTGLATRCVAWVLTGRSSQTDNLRAGLPDCDRATLRVRGLPSLRSRFGALFACATPCVCQDHPASSRPAHQYQSVPSSSSPSRPCWALGKFSLTRLTRRDCARAYPPALSVSPSVHIGRTLP